MKADEIMDVKKEKVGNNDYFLCFYAAIYF